jgi:hypothetical protein
MSRLHIEQILNNPIYRKFITITREELFQEWLSSDSVEQREAVFVRLKALEEMHDYFRSEFIIEGEKNGRTE